MTDHKVLENVEYFQYVRIWITNDTLQFVIQDRHGKSSDGHAEDCLQWQMGLKFQEDTEVLSPGR
jgi:hypothetical protein